MPSSASVIEYYVRLYPDLSPRELEVLAKDVASIIIPKELHQQVSETYGGRNTKYQIEIDSQDLRAASDKNFDAIKPSLKNYGASEVQLEAARAKMHKLNEAVGLYK